MVGLPFPAHASQTSSTSPELPHIGGRVATLLQGLDSLRYLPRLRLGDGAVVPADSLADGSEEFLLSRLHFFSFRQVWAIRHHRKSHRDLNGFGFGLDSDWIGLDYGDI